MSRASCRASARPRRIEIVVETARDQRAVRHKKIRRRVVVSTTIIRITTIAISGRAVIQVPARRRRHLIVGALHDDRLSETVAREAARHTQLPTVVDRIKVHGEVRVTIACGRNRQLIADQIAGDAHGALAVRELFDVFLSVGVKGHLRRFRRGQRDRSPLPIYRKHVGRFHAPQQHFRNALATAGTAKGECFNEDSLPLS